MEKMLDTLVSEQKRLADGQGAIFGKIDNINSRLEDIIRIEERQQNDRTAISRMGNHIDKLEGKIEAQEKVITNIRVVNAATAVKLTLIGGGGGSMVTAAIGAVLYLVGFGPAPGGG